MLNMTSDTETKADYPRGGHNFVEKPVTTFGK